MVRLTGAVAAAPPPLVSWAVAVIVSLACARASGARQSRAATPTGARRERVT